MNGLFWALPVLAVAGAAFSLWQWFRRRLTLRQLNVMLDRAIAGGFTEERFDETEMSALEGKLARFLRGSAHAQKTVEREQAAVKTLIADISHQTRTPISNLLFIWLASYGKRPAAAAAGTGPCDHSPGRKIIFSHSGHGEGIQTGNRDRGSVAILPFCWNAVRRSRGTGSTGGAGKRNCTAGDSL